ncbi:uncharacterized protein LOC112494526 [Cephus cinctus]|uniref:Uncharacterized protein LOC112494526 n=1 Tax=Cephus cinctus TaxID=211228 RepID=A0AAJ7W2D7_CEPCN|nr:uncharacterized protein LOC112494526 [Cephus cinctus]
MAVSMTTTSRCRYIYIFFKHTCTYPYTRQRDQTLRGGHYVYDIHVYIAVLAAYRGEEGHWNLYTIILKAKTHCAPSLDFRLQVEKERYEDLRAAERWTYLKMLKGECLKVNGSATLAPPVNDTVKPVDNFVRPRWLSNLHTTESYRDVYLNKSS